MPVDHPELQLPDQNLLILQQPLLLCLPVTNSQAIKDKTRLKHFLSKITHILMTAKLCHPSLPTKPSSHFLIKICGHLLFGDLDPVGSNFNFNLLHCDGLILWCLSCRAQSALNFVQFLFYTFKSLWTTPFWWQWLTDSKICWMQCDASASE